MAGTVVFSALTLFAFLRRSAPSDPLIIAGAVTVVGLMILDKQFMYGSVTLRSVRRVGTAGLWMGLLGVVELVLAVGLTWRFGLYGLYGALLVAGGITCSAMFLTQPLRATLHFEWVAFRRLAVASFVMMGFGLTTVALHNIDRVAIAYDQGASADLGQYHVASIISLLVNVLPYVTIAVISPEIYRFSGSRYLELRRYLLLPTLMTSTLSAVVVAGAWLVLPPVLQWVLPDYVAVPSLLVALMIGELFFSVAMVSENIVVALDRGSRGLLVRWGTILAGLAASFWVLREGGGIVGVAQVMCLTQVAGGLTIGVMAATGTQIPVARYLFMVLAPVVYTALLMGGVHLIFGSGPLATEVALLRILVGAVALLPLIVVPMGYFRRGPMASPRVSEYLYHFTR
jgi:hypothetical protein